MRVLVGMFDRRHRIGTSPRRDRPAMGKTFVLPVVRDPVRQRFARDGERDEREGDDSEEAEDRRPGHEG